MQQLTTLEEILEWSDWIIDRLEGKDTRTSREEGMLMFARGLGCIAEDQLALRQEFMELKSRVKKLEQTNG